MKTFYFDTGVKPSSGSSLFGRQVWRNGTKQIPFTCDAPENAVFMFASNFTDLPESNNPNVIVREILDNGPDGMLSKFAYFKTRKAN